MDERWFFLLFSIATGAGTMFCIIVGGAQVWNAMMSGRFQANNTSYDRWRQPFRFYGAIVFVVLMSVMFAFMTYATFFHMFLPLFAMK